MDSYGRYKKFKKNLLNDIEKELINRRKNLKKAVKKYKPLGVPSQYAGKEIARDLEKYIGVFPFTIDNDDKYEKSLITAKNLMLENNFKPSKVPKCSPINDKSVPENHKLLVVYYNPIPAKYNTGTPGFALIDQSKYKKIKCNQKIKKGGRKTRRRKKKGGMFSPYAICAMTKAEDNMRKEWNEEWQREQELLNRCDNPINLPLNDQGTQTSGPFFMVIPLEPKYKKKSTRKNRFRRGGKRKTYNKKKKKKRSCTKKKR